MARLKINKSGNARMQRVQTYMKAYLSLYGDDETIELSDFGTYQSVKVHFSDSTLFVALDRHEFSIRAKAGIDENKVFLSRSVDKEASITTIASQLKLLRQCALQIAGGMHLIKLAFPNGMYSGFRCGIKLC